MVVNEKDPAAGPAVEAQILGAFRDGADLCLSTVSELKRRPVRISPPPSSSIPLHSHIQFRGDLNLFSICHL